MNKFAFLVNPVDLTNVYQFFPLSRIIPAYFIKRILRSIAPFQIDHINNIRSITGDEIEAYFIVCPLLSKQMLEMNEDYVINKVLSASKLAIKLNVDLIGLGAVTASIGRGGEVIADTLRIPVTNGTSLASAAVLQTLDKAVYLKKIKLESAKIAIVGATNAIGQNCSLAFLNRVASIVLIGKNKDRLSDLKSYLLQQSPGTDIKVAFEKVEDELIDSDIIIFTTMSLEIPFKTTIYNLKKNAIICDIPAPRNISEDILKLRNDILVIDGAAIKLPYDTKFSFKMPLGNNSIYACMAETMLLTFEKRFQDSFSIGFKPDLEKVNEISRLAKKHGFEILFTSFGKPIQNESTPNG